MIWKALNTRSNIVRTVYSTKKARENDSKTWKESVLWLGSPSYIKRPGIDTNLIHEIKYSIEMAITPPLHVNVFHRANRVWSEIQINLSGAAKRIDEICTAAPNCSISPVLRVIRKQLPRKTSLRIRRTSRRRRCPDTGRTMAKLFIRHRVHHLVMETTITFPVRPAVVSNASALIAPPFRVGIFL